jgi:nickel superoxide dismutase
MKRAFLGAFAAVAVIGSAALAGAHCQIPCGIYDDELRVRLIEEHITTVEKSMNQIVALGKESPINYNQITRWVSNKELHAQEIQDIVTAYFMAQRIKPADSSDAAAHAEYAERLMLLHHIQVHAMKVKQTTDLEHIQHLRDLVKKFRTAYFGEQGDHSH